MEVEVRPAGGAEMTAFAQLWESAWGFNSGDEGRRRIAVSVAEERPLAAYADGTLSGTTMSFSMELTVPGHQRLPMAGVSYVAVHPLRRRQGILRALMRRQLDDLRDQGVPVAGLGASEAGIYRRFGYGPATWDSSWRLARGAVRHLAGASDTVLGTTLDLVDPRAAADLFPAVRDQARQARVGDIQAYPGWWHDQSDGTGLDGRHFLVARDPAGTPSGYAIYRFDRAERFSSHVTVIVEHLIAVTPAAYRALWAFIADLDLTDWVIAGGRPEHEPLQWMLPDRRQLQVTSVHDHLWVRLIDLPAALAGRRYATGGGVLLDVTDTFGPWNEGRWLLEGGPDGAACRRATGGSRGAVIALDAPALASLYLGGTSVARLAAAGLIDGDSTSLERAGQLFGAGQDPWCSTYF